MSSHWSRRKSWLILVPATLLWLVACRPTSEEDLTDQPRPYELERPFRFPAPYLSSENPLTYEGIELGRKLYSDPILSSNGRSCSSCHIRSKSYSIPLFIAQNGDRVSVPPHVNLAFNPEYNWNGNQPVLDTLCMADFEPEFFNTNRDTLYRRLSNHPEYPGLFQRAFGIRDVNEVDYQTLKTRICYAISQYMRTLVSADSKYDRYAQHKEQLSVAEMKGMILFFSEKGDCFHCHGAPLFTDNLFHNVGIDSVFVGQDAGRYLVTGNPDHIGLFSTPTLRNIAHTAPYMHDGRFATLEEVVEFYNSGVKHSATLDPLMTKAGKERGLMLTEYEKFCLVAFLKTLTDENFINP